MSVRLSALQTQFGEIRSGIEAIEASAVAGNRDLTEQETTDVEALYVRAEALDSEIKPLVARHNSINATADVLNRLNVARPNPGSAPAIDKAAPMPTAAEYISAYLRSVGPRADQAAVEHFRQVLHRAAPAEAVIADHDSPGLVPTPVVGSLIATFDDRRPLVASLNRQPMPADGSSFWRPRISQRTKVGEQMAEFDELETQTFKTTSAQVDKRVFGSVLDVSYQDQAWTSPAVMGLILADFTAQYGNKTEAAVATAFVAAVTNTHTFNFGTTADTLTSLTEAAVELYGTAGAMPTTLWLALDQWSALASLVDGMDRPLFPGLGAGAINVSTGDFSGQPLGLNVVVAPALAAGTIILGSPRFGEVYEKENGFLRVEQPGVLGTQVAIWGELATYFVADGFISITNAT